MVKRHYNKSEQQEASNKPARSGLLVAFQKNQAALRHYISRFVRRNSDIDDIAQEAFLRAYRAECSRDEPLEQPKSYLFKVAHNVAVSELQKKSTHILDCLEDIDELSVPWVEQTLEDDVMARQTVGIHCEAVAALPAQCRRVYLMRKVHGMSHREIADRLGIKQSTIEKHVSKGVRDCARYVRLRQAGLDPADPSVNAAANLATSKVTPNITAGAGGQTHDE